MSTRSPSLRARVAELEADRDKAYRYAKRFLSFFVEQNFPPNPDWKPLPDLMGVLTQIDNASTIARDLRVRVTKLEAALEEARSGIAQRCPWLDDTCSLASTPPSRRRAGNEHV